MPEIIILAILGIAAGSISGLLGIGGAVIIIPALVYFLHFSQKMAQGTSLLLMLPPIGLLAALEYYRSGQVNIKAAVIIAVFFLLGGWIGAKLAVKIDPLLLRRIFAVFLMVIAIRMFIK